MNKVHYSSKSNEWETPQELFDELNKEFNFTLDPCATAQNAKCKRYFSKANDELSMCGYGKDGLSMCWDEEVVFCNPPYGREIGEWVEKASRTRGLVVMLLPARTDTSYFHDYIYNKAEIRFIRGRLKFSNSKIGAPFPSMIVIFRSKE